jgi:hypothetical protein
MAFVGRLMHKLVFIFREALSLSAPYSTLVHLTGAHPSAAGILLLMHSAEWSWEKIKIYTH